MTQDPISNPKSETSSRGFDNTIVEDLYKKFPTGILDDVDIREVLKISRRTSLEYRQKGYLRYHRFADDSKIFYLLDELIEDIRNSAK